MLVRISGEDGSRRVARPDFEPYFTRCRNEGFAFTLIQITNTYSVSAAQLIKTNRISFPVKGFCLM